MTRIQTFLIDNPPSGQDGIDLYNHTYFTDIHPTITTSYSSGNCKFIMERKDSILYKEMPNGNIRAYRDDDKKSGVSELQIIHPDNVAQTITTAHIPKTILNYRIRKLTPKECFRLMGVADTDSDKMMSVLSKSRCYQVAGNSIVVDVLAAIFDQLFNENKNTNQQTELF